MNSLKLKSLTLSMAICALSLASATAFAAGGARANGSATAHASMRTTTSAPLSTTRSMPTKSVATSAKARTTARSTGQPNASCEETPNQPGHSISAPGSAFNPDGVAGTKYAGEQPQNSRNPKSVSQYDVACARPTH